jgi:putative ubiquitin-RnfH superfamily antitoxin RatB of RatAB toxin-antitoxin module
MTSSVLNIHVEVVYADIHKQHLKSVILHLSSAKESKTVRDAILHSGLLELYPEIVDWENRLGIFGQQCSPDTIIKNGDRIELYRDLLQSPKEARIERVKQAKKAIAREKSKPKKKKITK